MSSIPETLRARTAQAIEKLRSESRPDSHGFGCPDDGEEMTADCAICGKIQPDPREVLADLIAELLAACDAGAQAYEIVALVFGSNPWVKHESGSYQCAFCRTYRTQKEMLDLEDWFLHLGNCLWLRARSLLHGSPQP